MPHFEFASDDHSRIITVSVSELDGGGCSIDRCETRPLNTQPAKQASTEKTDEAPEPEKKQPKKKKQPKTSKPGGFTLAKAQKFIRAWAGMMRQGAVSTEIYEYRRGLCEGVEGLNPPCPHNKRMTTGAHYCDKCGCGKRKYATLYVEGEEPGSTERLFFPDPQCPIMAMRPMPGSGSLKQVGGRIKQVGKLLLAGKEELKNRGVDESQAGAFLSELEGGDDGNS